MKIIRNNIIINKIEVPSIEIIPNDFKGEILLIHGYGGSKEEILGLGYRLAQERYKCICIDLRGHGESKFLYDDNILLDINEIIGTMDKNKIRIAAGHSLGGRIALLSNADIKIGMSPALAKDYSEQTNKFIKSMRQHKVNEVHNNINFEFLYNLPLVNEHLSENDLIIYGEKDVPEIIQEISILSKGFKNIHKINFAFHGDTFIMEEAITVIKNHILKHSNT